MDWRRILAALILVGLAGGSWWLLQRDRAGPPPGEADQPEKPDQYFDRAVIRQLGADGATAYRLEAGRITRDEATGRIEMTGVDARYLDRQGPPWRLTAREGIIPSVDSREVLLKGDVEVARPGREGTPPVSMRAPRMTVDSRRNVLETDQRATIDYGATTMRADGLVAHLAENRLELGGNIEGEYVP